ncbi:5-oxoprolinase (ATP-hydrolysing) [Cyclonatronum proteinivorum]|uniref:5-oxoprolinase (ATP-hydrolysing) n=1 Tax=Cyclonatronum proteinivorum TaxID=1457365 RepID=A0A345UPW5_9BACT|nr:hydantoinase B/oxoprolinase family protein [Cyclonatronum proteinivorum]AXJ02517.1 5-oxoprolinase (ATP-hydrolysing) [Cyclonatronum proteinivorum]
MRDNETSKYTARDGGGRFFVFANIPLHPAKGFYFGAIHATPINIFLIMTRTAETLPLLCIDKGGTFTDCLFRKSGGALVRFKLLSSGEWRVACTNGAKPDELALRLSETERAQVKLGGLQGFQARVAGDGGDVLCRVTEACPDTGLLRCDAPLPADVRSVSLFTGEDAPVVAARLLTGTPAGEPLPPLHWRLAGTQTTNALLEGRHAPTALILSEGFADLLRIGNQQRPDIFALKVEQPAPLYRAVATVPGLISASGEVLEKLQAADLEPLLARWKADGIEAVAVCLRNAWKNPGHEQQLGVLIREAGFAHVVLSSETAPLIHYLDRSRTTLINALLSPVLAQWRRDLTQAAPDGLRYAMSSAGGLLPFATFKPVDSLLSGPAAGVTGAAASGKAAGFDTLLTFDMGGTSTDVARIAGRPGLRFSHRVGDAEVMAPAADIETVAAGGGSICRFDGYRLQVGPESAGADPGPAAYGRGGPLTLTDINLLAGRIPASDFSIPLDLAASERQFEALRREMATSPGVLPQRETLIRDLLDIANERMAGAIRAVSVQRGYRASEHALVSFGGAGGQHACELAALLGIRQVLFPGFASVLSAYGLMHAQREEIAEQQLLLPFERWVAEAADIIQTLHQELRDRFSDDENARTELSLVLQLRLTGQEESLPVTMPLEAYEAGRAREEFAQAWLARYGMPLRDDAQLEAASVRLIARLPKETPSEHIHQNKTSQSGEGVTAYPQRKVQVLTGKHTQAVPLLSREALAGRLNPLPGPALISGGATTVYLAPGWSAVLDANGTLIAERSADDTRHHAPESDASRLSSARLELAGNRLQSIANEMGEVLQRSSVSVNIRERLDFSCAVFDASGYLVANAAHIPVHLGALGLCVRGLMARLEMKPDSVYITNHPAFGGSHLPDVTVVSPFFAEGRLQALVANRAHHAEIGGTRPGSMSPDAAHLGEEGCVIPPLCIVEGSQPRFEALRACLTDGPWPTRALRENLGDIESAIAANRRGLQRLADWTARHGTEDLRESMQLILDYGEIRTREMLAKSGLSEVRAEELLDDGTPLRVKAALRDGLLHLDFSGSGAVHPGNLNATPAIVSSVVMYVLRVLLSEPVPLNKGLMRAVRLHLPPGTLLNPDFGEAPEACPAVFGGNTEVSQRLTDTLLKAFGKAACSQGTMNNLLFGNARFGFYETLGGGTGAGEGFAGADAVHHHMTNTRITDAEVLESRYQVRVTRLEIRQDSGGTGKWRGGDGMIRELEFLEPVSLTLLSEHRKQQPYGLAGGEAGASGRQLIIRADGSTETLAGQAKVQLKAGDRFRIETPGGGGFGAG